MFGKVDHVASAVRSLDESMGDVCATLGLEVIREFELPEYGIRAAFVGDGNVVLELVEFQQPEVAAARLGDRSIALDHIAYEVPDIEHTAELLAGMGVRFCAPNGDALDAPLELRGTRHLWTVPGTSAGVPLQLIERS